MFSRIRKDVLCYSVGEDDSEENTAASSTEPPQAAPQGEEGAPGSERQHAAALLLACTHLPASLLSSGAWPGQRRAMLDEAARTYERLGDRRALRRCHTVMLHAAAAAAPLQPRRNGVISSLPTARHALVQ